MAIYLDKTILIFEEEDAKKIYTEKYFGKFIDFGEKKALQLSFEESLYLLESKKITIKNNKDNKILDFELFYKICSDLDKELYQKYCVYRDIRKKGYIIKSGFKFGTHFRVYEKGVNPYKTGDKTKKEHTKYNVHSVMENDVFVYNEISRYVRLSHNIRSIALLGVVDSEGQVTYYSVQRIKL